MYFFAIFAVMKVSLAVIGLLLFLLGCRPSPVGGGARVASIQEQPSVLADIDSLMWSRPDSAFVLLQERFSPDDPYAQLLLAELFYKNYYGQSNRGDLLRAVGYFDTVGDAFLDARAHYINGVGYYENDSVAEACQEYLKALEIMEDHFKEKELVGHKAQFMALTLTRLTTLYSLQYLPVQANYFAKRSLKYSNKYDTEPWVNAWLLEQIGMNYHMLNQLDSASYYYTIALSVLEDTNTLIYRDIKAHQTMTDYRKGMPYSKVIPSLKNLISQSKSEKEFYARCALVGEVYFDEAFYDSAAVYLDKVFGGNATQSLKKQSAEWLVTLNSARTNPIDLSEHTAFLVPFANVSENNSIIKSRLSELYHDYRHGKHVASFPKGSDRIRMWAWITLCVLAFVFLSFFVSFAINKKKQKALGLIKNNMKILEDEIARLNKGRQSNRPVATRAPRGEYEKLLKERICLKIQANCEETKRITSFNVKDFVGLSLSVQEMIEYDKAIKSHCPDFSKTLRFLHPMLSSKDLQLCQFYLLELSMLQVAVLLGTDYSSIRKRTKRLKEKIGDEDLYQRLKSDLFEID